MFRREITYHADSLQREDGSAEEQRPLLPIRDGVRRFVGWHVLKHVPERDDHTGADQKVCDHGERSQILEIANQVHCDQQRQHDQHEPPDVELCFKVKIRDLQTNRISVCSPVDFLLS